MAFGGIEGKIGFAEDCAGFVRPRMNSPTHANTACRLQAGGSGLERGVSKCLANPLDLDRLRGGLRRLRSPEDELANSRQYCMSPAGWRIRFGTGRQQMFGEPARPGPERFGRRTREARL